MKRFGTEKEINLDDDDIEFVVHQVTLFSSVVNKADAMICFVPVICCYVFVDSLFLWNHCVVPDIYLSCVLMYVYVCVHRCGGRAALHLDAASEDT
jgi:hypothetical protein